MPEFKAIDAVFGFELDDPEVRRPAYSQKWLQNKMGVESSTVTGFSPQQLLDKMDRAGVEHAFLLAIRTSGPGRNVPYEKVAELVQRYPHRFSGLAGIDPTTGMKGVRELERAVKELGFIGAHFYPHWFGMSPDHARVYPFYAKCVELDIPIQMQVGHCLLYNPDYPLKSVGRPITLDTIACDFPELKLVGIHIGWPWSEEMISVAWKHPNVYIGSDAYAPKHWPKEFVHFLDSWGQDKVLFGTDFPVIDPERAMPEIEALGLRPVQKRKFLRDNAIRLYRLSLPLSTAGGDQAG